MRLSYSAVYSPIYLFIYLISLIVLVSYSTLLDGVLQLSIVFHHQYDFHHGLPLMKFDAGVQRNDYAALPLLYRDNGGN